MAHIRELFHKVGNWHNKISVGAGVVKAELRQKFKGSRPPKEMQKIIKRLTELEQYAVSAGEVLHQLKDAVYGVIDPDAAKPGKREANAKEKD